jgi:hypothetical protein
MTHDTIAWLNWRTLAELALLCVLLARFVLPSAWTKYRAFRVVWWIALWPSALVLVMLTYFLEFFT